MPGESGQRGRGIHCKTFVTAAVLRLPALAGNTAAMLAFVNAKNAVRLACRSTRLSALFKQ